MAGRHGRPPWPPDRPLRIAPQVPGWFDVICLSQASSKLKVDKEKLSFDPQRLSNQRNVPVLFLLFGRPACYYIPLNRRRQYTQWNNGTKASWSPPQRRSRSYEKDCRNVSRSSTPISRPGFARQEHRSRHRYSKPARLQTRYHPRRNPARPRRPSTTDSQYLPKEKGITTSLSSLSSARNSSSPRLTNPPKYRTSSPPFLNRNHHLSRIRRRPRRQK